MTAPWQQQLDAAIDRSVGAMVVFFRFHSPSHILVYAWINDDDTLRAYGSKSDAYRTFQKMLDSGHPPETWDTLLKEAKGLE